MTCDDVRRHIHEAHDDGRVVALPELVLTHIAACNGCRELNDDLLSLSRTLRELPLVPLPADALDAVWRETIRARSKARSTTAGVWRLRAAAIFVTALSTATFYFIFVPAPPSGPSTVELARASAQAEMVFGYTARALAATRDATAGRVLASKVSPAVRGVAASHPSRRPS